MFFFIFIASRICFFAIDCSSLSLSLSHILFYVSYYFLWVKFWQALNISNFHQSYWICLELTKELIWSSLTFIEVQNGAASYPVLSSFQSLWSTVLIKCCSCANADRRHACYLVLFKHYQQYIFTALSMSFTHMVLWDLLEHRLVDIIISKSPKASAEKGFIKVMTVNIQSMQECGRGVETMVWHMKSFEEEVRKIHLINMGRPCCFWQEWDMNICIRMHIWNREIKLYVNSVFAKATLILDQASSWAFVC